MEAGVGGGGFDNGVKNFIGPLLSVNKGKKWFVTWLIRKESDEQSCHNSFNQPASFSIAVSTDDESDWLHLLLYLLYYILIVIR